MDEYYLLIDIGTGSTRAAFTDSAGNIIGMRSVMNTYQRDPAYPDAQYFIPSDWEREILACCDALHSEHPEIRAKAVSAAGTRQTILLLDSEGRAFFGLPNIDNRGREFMDTLSGLEDELYRLSGKWVTEDFCAAKLMGLRLRRPEIYARAAQVLSASEWIARLFTGRSYMEPTMACETQLYDLAGGEWSDRLCSVYGVDTSLLPELAPCGSAAGAILDEYVVRFNMADDAIFIIGGADTQLALRQTGLQAGEVAIVSGTTSPVVTLLDAPIWDEQQRLWIDAGLGGKGFLAEMNPGVTGLNYQRIKDMLCPETSYEELEQAYSEMKTFRCTASFSSLLFYERKSLRRGGFFARSPLDEHLTRIDMVWAVLADIACSTYEQLWRLTDITGVSTGHILGCGGGLRSGTLCSMLAELSGLELRLRTGFEQATIQGLSDVCADGLGHKAAVEESPVLSFPPGEYPLIREYYPVWLENREKANSL